MPDRRKADPIRRLDAEALELERWVLALADRASANVDLMRHHHLWLTDRGNMRRPDDVLRGLRAVVCMERIERRLRGIAADRRRLAACGRLFQKLGYLRSIARGCTAITELVDELVELRTQACMT